MSGGNLDKDQAGLDPESSLRAFLNKFGEQVIDRLGAFDEFPGVVEDNNDPEKLGRIKVRVHAVYGTIPTADLPWAVPDEHDHGPKTGRFVVPVVNSLVNVRFSGNDIYQPKFRGRPWFKSRLPDERTEDYPDTAILYNDDDGNQVIYNRRTKKWTFRTSAGVLLKVDTNGNIVLDATASEGKVVVSSRTKVVIEAAEVEIANDTGSRVTPNPGMGGPFNCIPNCLFNGAPHQGKKVGNCMVKSSDI